MSRTPANMIGSYGPWAAELQSARPHRLSPLDGKWDTVDSWKHAARREFAELMGLAALRTGGVAEASAPRAEVLEVRTFEGLHVEKLRWQLPYGPATDAVFLKPEGASGPLPGVLGLHDHGGVKYFGWEKIARTSGDTHPFLINHQRDCYGGVAWANELARRGYGVLVHDVIAFGSRRINPSELPAVVVNRMMGPAELARELRPEDVSGDAVLRTYDVSPAATASEIDAYHVFARQHEDIIAKSLLSAGVTWPGVFVNEDLAAVDYLCSRPDIDSGRVGCCGLSGGGLRTNYLAGLDDRIACSVTAGFMTTWRDLILHRCFTHTWMVYIPLLPALMQYPEILAMRAPLPTMVFATDEDPLFTLQEVKLAARTLGEVFDKAGAPDRFSFALREGPHQFNRPMQEEAFDWFDQWLRCTPASDT